MKTKICVYCRNNVSSAGEEKYYGRVMQNTMNHAVFWVP